LIAVSMLAATTHTASADTTTTTTTTTTTDAELIAHAKAVHHVKHVIRHRRHRARRLAASLGMHYDPRPIADQQSDLGYLRYIAQRVRKRNHRYLALRHSLFPKLRCIHHYEGAWNAYNAAGPYYGGFQMDAGFMARWGADKLHKYGGHDARYWSARDQMAVASRAARHIGFGSWPNTAAMCGVL
jgi:hypothetical protein